MNTCENRYGLMPALFLALFVAEPRQCGASALEPGESVAARVFAGAAAGSAAGNPAADGQGWFRKDFATPLNFHSDGQDRWASAAAKPGGTYVSFCDVRTNAAGAIRIQDAYSGAIGAAWVYAPAAGGVYALSFDSFAAGSYMRGRVVSRENSSEPWVDVSESFDRGKTHAGAAFTNELGAGGGLAFVAWNSNAAAADAVGTITGLKATYLAALTDTPAVSLSADARALQENPLRQGAEGVRITARLGELSSRDTTIDLAFGGDAVLGADYRATAAQMIIPAGMRRAEIVLSAIDNSAAAGDKTIAVSIGALENATAGAADSIAVALVDDERVLARAGDELFASVFCGDAEGGASGNPNASGQAWRRKDLATPLLYYFGGTATSKWATAEVKINQEPYTYSHVTTRSATQLDVRDDWYAAVGVGWVYTASEPGLYALSCSKLIGNYVRSEFLHKEDGAPEWSSLSGLTNTLASGYAVTNWLNSGDALAVRLHNSNAMATSMTATIDDLKISLLATLPKHTLLLIK